MSLFDHHSFRELAKGRGVRPRQYGAVFDCLLALDVVTAIEQAGNDILERGKRDVMSRDKAGSLLQRLLTCYAAPSEHLDELAEIQKELRRYDE